MNSLRVDLSEGDIEPPVDSPRPAPRTLRPELYNKVHDCRTLFLANESVSLASDSYRTHQIWPGSSGSGSRTGRSGFSGGSGGSWIGDGSGSPGMRSRSGTGRFTSCCMALRCKNSDDRQCKFCQSDINEKSGPREARTEDLSESFSRFTSDPSSRSRVRRIAAGRSDRWARIARGRVHPGTIGRCSTITIALATASPGIRWVRTRAWV